MFETRVTELFGIKYPIIMGGMGNIGAAELVAAVANAGGIGFLGSIRFSSGEELRQEIRKTRTLTDKPFGVNISMLPAARPIPNEEFVDVIIEEGVSAVETAARSPEPFIERLKKANVRVIHKVSSVRHALTAQRLGCDAVYALGFEAGGHPLMDDVTLWNLVPRMVDALDIPVVAAGGISDARQFVAALALGAEGVMMATRFVVTQECCAHQNIKERLVQATERDTVMIQRSIGNQTRVLRNEPARKVEEMENRGASLEELLTVIGGEHSMRAMEEGDVDTGIITCGQGIGLIQKIPTVREVIDSMVNEAAVLLSKIGSR